MCDGSLLDSRETFGAHAPCLYADICQKSPLTNNREVTTNKNDVTPYCVNPRLKQDIRSIFISNYLVYRQEISQRATIITVCSVRDSANIREVSSNFLVISIPEQLSFAVAPSGLFSSTNLNIDKCSSAKPSNG